MSERAKPFEEIARRTRNLHQKMADAIGNPDTVRCHGCGRTEAVNAAHALAHGWPKCCGATMSLDGRKAGSP